MKVSDNFSREEFRCKCGCQFDTVDVELLEVLEDVRQHFGNPVRINSACRCISHNHSVGGSSHSQHLLGKACDIIVDNVHPSAVHYYLDSKYRLKYGVGKYNSFTHIDVREKMSRWEG